MKTLVENQFRKSILAAPDRILVATDLTDVDYLIPHAIAQAKAGGARVTLIHALSPSDVVPMDGSTIPYVDKTKIARDARVALLAAARRLEAEGILCKTAVRDGIPDEVIPEELRQSGATRLILGTHGRGKLGQLTMGSVARELIKNVNVPVFIVGPHARAGFPHFTPRKILHPVSLMGAYRDSLGLALEIAQTYRTELTLLHVLDRDQDETMNPERTVEWARNALRALIPDTTRLAPPVHVEVTSGRISEEILKAAERCEADWIVLGADGGALSWPFSESAAYKVTTAAKCPVLTLRHEPVLTEEAVDLEKVHFTFPV